MSVTVPFVTRVVKDYTSGNIMRNEATLARDLRIVIEKLGPTFIKVRCEVFVCTSVWFGFVVLACPPATNGFVSAARPRVRLYANSLASFWRVRPRSESEKQRRLQQSALKKRGRLC